MVVSAITRHPVLITYVSLFTAFAICVLVQFVRKRREYFLKERHPVEAVMQLTTSLLSWVTSNIVVQLVPPQADVDSPDCELWFANNCLILRMILLVSFMELLTWRIWKLFWRQHLHNHLSSQRDQIREFGLTPSRQTLEHAAASWRFRLAKYGAPPYFVLIALLNLSTPIYVLAHGTCASIDDIGRKIVTNFCIYSLGLFFVVIAWMVRKYSDNFHFAEEFKRYGVIAVVGLACYSPRFAIRDRVLAVGVVNLITTFVTHAMFIVGGVVPIYEQWLLEKTVAADNFVQFERFDALLANAAGLVSFEKFMRREFCEEVLEFYQVVAEYKRMFALRSREEQRTAATVIFGCFVDVDAPSQINISAEILKSIRAQLYPEREDDRERGSDGNDVSESVFDEAQAAMYRLMREGPYVQYMIRQGRLEESRGRDNEPAKGKPDAEAVVPVDT